MFSMFSMFRLRRAIANRGLRELAPIKRILVSVAGGRVQRGAGRRRRGLLGARVSAVAGAALVLLAGWCASSAVASTWNIGDVFVGVNNGQYNVYDNSGTFKETIDQGNNARFTTGCAFDANSDLYTTNFSGGQVIKFSGTDPHSVLQTIAATNGAEDVVFDQAGNFYVSAARGADVIHKYNAAGTFVTDYATGESDWLDLAANQTTMFFTGESGGRIQRFDLAGNAALTDFATVAATAYALRLLPPGDGSGGLLVADSADIKRLDGSGSVVQTYDATGQNNWFALNLDPNGTSFWSGDLSTGNFYRFNIATGALEVGPIAAGASSGICVKGEHTAAVPPPPPPPPPSGGGGHVAPGGDAGNGGGGGNGGRGPLVVGDGGNGGNAGPCGGGGGGGGAIASGGGGAGGGGCFFIPFVESLGSGEVAVSAGAAEAGTTAQAEAFIDQPRQRNARATRLQMVGQTTLQGLGIGWHPLAVRFNAKTRKQLKRLRKSTVTLRLRMTGPTGPPLIITRTVTLKR
ncbi:MAG: hypothetical protein QOK04_1698 [Solirubrobacteraceae bacterium]|nr:hypothetical protein [Solirubrobacteraceae bacterium]